MNLELAQRQRGASMIGMLFIAIVLAAVGLVVVQVVPTVSEYQAIEKAANKASAGNTVAEVRAIFDKVSSIDDFGSVTGKDLVVTKEGDKVVVSFDYIREIHLFGPAYLTLKYSGRSR
jgi:flagellar basal body-associated protein FliL